MIMTMGRGVRMMTQGENDDYDKEEEHAEKAENDDDLEKEGKENDD